ncbi:MAG TPA: tRNA (adenosine(37)-N6)-threonylcarbamoyltransferase complex dimerization subunit type 1 TsaB [Allosphingosinicella sp.]|jgi:tRNA threonylcarbamoyl adenosine modification protein YeaZ
MILVIDSATAACSAALIEFGAVGGDIIDERHEVVGRGHAERLLPMIADLLGDRTPDAILVDCGPGSFTGVRVGLAAAHGLAIGWGVPVQGYSSMAAVAAASGAGHVTVALQGGHGELFVQSFGGDPLAPLDALRSLAPDAAAEAAAAPLVAGSGAEAVALLRGHGEWRDALPRAADARLLPHDLRALPPRPIYGRAPDAKPQP